MYYYKYHMLKNYMYMLNFMIIAFLGTIFLIYINNIKIYIFYSVINLLLYYILFIRYNIFINELLIISGISIGNIFLNLRCKNKL